MNPRPKSKAQKNKERNRIILSVAGLALGYYMLNHVATWEKPPLGQEFHIVIGCAFIAVSGIVLVNILKGRFFPKKKRKSRSSHVFLDDVLKKEQDQKKNPKGESTV